MAHCFLVFAISLSFPVLGWYSVDDLVKVHTSMICSREKFYDNPMTGSVSEKHKLLPEQFHPNVEQQGGFDQGHLPALRTSTHSDDLGLTLYQLKEAWSNFFKLTHPRGDNHAVSN